MHFLTSEIVVGTKSSLISHRCKLIDTVAKHKSTTETMPDPVTILLNATAMVQLAEYAYNFAEAIYSFTKLKPDQELDELACEVDSFRRACDLVGGQLQELGSISAPEDSQGKQLDLVDPKLSRCFGTTIVDCRTTMKQLEDLVSRLRDRHSGWDKKVRFLRKKESISHIRKRIHSHILALHLVLQSFNMY